MSRILDVSESGYYRYVKDRDKPTRDTLLLAAIREILEEHPYNGNGARRIQLALAQRGMKAGVRKLTRTAGCTSGNGVQKA